MPILAMTKLRNRIANLNPALKIELRNVRVNGQLYGCSGFVTNLDTGAIAYVSTDNNGIAGERRAMYRTAKDTRDYSGGQNLWAAHDDLPQAIVKLLDRKRAA